MAANEALYAKEPLEYMIRPNLWLSGHLHECFLEAPGGEHDTYGYPCALVCSSDVDKERNQHISGAVTLTKGGIYVKYVNEKKEVTHGQRIPPGV